MELKKIIELKKQLKNCQESNLRLINESKRVMNNRIKQVFDDIEKCNKDDYAGWLELKKKHLR